MSDDVVIRLMDLPHAVKGAVSYSPDGTANVYINARLNREQQCKELEHELMHVDNDDVLNDDSIETIEMRASNGKAKLIPIYTLDKLVQMR